MPSKKIGLMLGSFNPPHIGHINAACKALEFVDEVWMMVAWQNPWKEHSTPFDKRVGMLKILLSDFKSYETKIYVSDMERNIKPQYTYQLIEHLEKTLPEFEFYIIGGNDVINDLTSKKWKNSDYILSQCHLLPIDRNEISISSSQIRNKIKDNKPLIPFLTNNLVEYIKQNKIFES